MRRYGTLTNNMMMARPRRRLNILFENSPNDFNVSVGDLQNHEQINLLRNVKT